ncbi:MAG: hypothetical protein HC862_10980 [Scytonema sp. RU_4_4]|nr:hypothetical protein [Scytonema sp. RU_4_4]
MNVILLAQRAWRAAKRSVAYLLRRRYANALARRWRKSYGQAAPTRSVSVRLRRAAGSGLSLPLGIASESQEMFRFAQHDISSIFARGLLY